MSSVWKNESLFGCRALCTFCHSDYGKRLPIFQRNFDILHGNIAFSPEQLCSRQCRPHLITPKTRCASRNFACLKYSAPDSASRPCWMHKERPNLGRVSLGVQQRILSPRPVVASVKRLPFAPTTATCEDPFQPGAFLSSDLSRF